MIVGALILPTVLLANHGIEAIGILAPVSAALIATVVCLIFTLVFLFRKKWAPLVAYMLFVLNFGLGILLVVMAGYLGVSVFLATAALHIILGIFVAIKTAKGSPNR